jgi:Tfp pilus assembly protein PilZ
MDGQRHERRQYFRAKARPGRVLPVRFKTTLHPGWIAAQTRNIGVGGAFIATSQVQVVGTSMTLALTLPTSEQVFTLPAIVRWAHGSEGMGVQFVGVDVDILLELNDYFSTLTA